LLALCEQLL
jgi:hypothetical protein